LKAFLKQGGFSSFMKNSAVKIIVSKKSKFWQFFFQW